MSKQRESAPGGEPGPRELDPALSEEQQPAEAPGGEPELPGPGPRQLYDLASLTKTLVTAPLALKHLDLELDRREQLSLGEHDSLPVTVVQLLSHSAGLPPWLPYAAAVGLQLQKVDGEGWNHALLRNGVRGTAVYSDVSFRLVNDLLEMELEEGGRSLYTPGGLFLYPWLEDSFALPVQMPPGPDRDAWSVAASHGLTDLAFPESHMSLPHDANARAGMRGHAGYAATARGFASVLHEWVDGGWPAKQAQNIAANPDGIVYGFGLHHAQPRYAAILSNVTRDVSGVVVGSFVEDENLADIHHIHQLPVQEDVCPEWWMHTGFAGCVLLVRPASPLVIGLVLNRLASDGSLLDLEGITSRRLELLTETLKRHTALQHTTTTT